MPSTQTTPLIKNDTLASSDRISKLLPFIGVFIMFSIGGICSGFSALKPVLLDMKVFVDQCSAENCVGQLLRINLIGQITFSALNIFVIPIGFLVDRISLKWMVLIGNIVTLISVASFGIILTFRVLDLYFWWLSIGFFVLIGLSQIPTYFATLDLLSFLPKKYEIFMNACLACAWDLSAVIFMLFNFIYFKNHIPIIYIFCGYAVIMTPMLLFFAFKFKPRLHVTVEEINSSESQILISKPTLKSQLFSKMYFSMVLYTAVTMLHFYFFMTTIYDQGLSITKGDLVETNKLNTAFSIILPAMGFLCPFLVAWLLQNMYRMLIGQMLMGLVFGICSTLPIGNLQYVTYIFFVPWRISVFIIVWYFAKKNFGITNYGMLISICYSISGLTTLLTSPINHFVAHQLYGNFMFVNIAFTVLSFFATFQFLYVYHHHKTLSMFNKVKS